MPIRWPASDLIPPTESLHRVIESEPLPRNVGTFLAQCTARSRDRQAWRFFMEAPQSPWAALTYAQLDAAVDRLACGMRAVGVCAGARVALLLPNVPAYPLSWLALARIGAVVIPMNM